MSGVARTVGKIAGIVASVALVVAAVATGNPALVAAAIKVATIATAVATVASVGAQLLQKKPPARGSPSQVLIQSDAPMPCILGRTYAGGYLRHDVGYGPTIKDVPNPYRAMVIVYSLGPCLALSAMYADFQQVAFAGNAATGYYSGFMYRDVQFGASPEPDALAGQWGGIPNWGASHKLSGKAAILWNLKFDKDGKVFASGLPQLGAVWQGVPAYDPRLDSTYPGGSGPQRWNDEASWAYSENPALHGLSYAIGRMRGGRKAFGVGIPIDGIDVASFVAHANVCDANSWKVGGVVFEPGDRWANLKDILAAGSGEPVFMGGKLGVAFDAPGVALDTITIDDLADEDSSVQAMGTWRQRLNGIVPKYRSEVSRWDYVPGDLVQVPTYVTEDGEEKTETIQYNLVQDATHAAQLAAYELVNRRELGDIVLICKPRLRHYKPGAKLTVDLPDDLGLPMQLCTLRQTTFDPATGKVSLVLRSETTSKHAFALGKTGTPPPTPALVPPVERDDVSDAVGRGKDGTNGINGAPGANGQTSYVHFAYANSPDGTVDFTTGAAGGRFYIGTYTDFIPADSADPASYTWSLFRGADGANGTPGAPGANGQATYVHIAYANSADGVADFSTTDGTGKRYIGTYTDQTLADSTNPASYTWSLIKGDDGAPGTPGSDGQSFGTIFRRDEGLPATPAPSTVTPSGWYEATGDVPAGSLPMWGSPWTRANATADRVYQKPYRAEGISAVQTGISVALGFAVSESIVFSLDAGASRIVEGSGELNAPAGNGTAYIQIEYREIGGGWSASNGVAEGYQPGEPAFPQHSIALTNSSGLPKTYEVRGTIVTSGGSAGVPNASGSRLRV